MMTPEEEIVKLKAEIERKDAALKEIRDRANSSSVWQIAENALKPPTRKVRTARCEVQLPEGTVRIAYGSLAAYNKDGGFGKFVCPEWTYEDKEIPE